MDQEQTGKSCIFCGPCLSQPWMDARRSAAAVISNWEPSVGFSALQDGGEQPGGSIGMSNLLASRRRANSQDAEAICRMGQATTRHHAESCMHTSRAHGAFAPLCLSRLPR